ncbi:MAG: hypothetical protein C0481_02330 [Phenylobacterium sp.]|uniref:hypothetical protein n=1 Tax=Phenylobacterium sp. TaxID=1871053 RepID=UPI0025D56CDF|nr:hypothetical protein [Phenylobacterium sp.]MBA4010681.1 hypothetical protein [Phenylobacterium sp.]
MQQVDELEAHTLLISAEDFSLDEFDDAALALIRDVSGAQEFVVVYGLRDPRRLIPSMWQQAVKWGLGRGEERLELAEASPALIERYRRSSELYLGGSTVALAEATLRPFIVPASHNSELCHRFLTAAGLDSAPLDAREPRARTNESIGYAQLRVLLELNRLAPIAVEPLDQDALLAREFVIRQLQETETAGGAIPIEPKLEARFDELRSYWTGLIERLPAVGDLADLCTKANDGGIVPTNSFLSAEVVLSGALVQAVRRANEVSAYAAEVAAARDWWRAKADDAVSRLAQARDPG